MAVAERQHRPTPKREGPKRAVLAREDRINGAAAAPLDGLARPAEGGVVSAAVSTAYRVVAENVEEGRLAAARLRAAATDPADAPPSAKEVANRLVHMTREMSATWGDLVLAVLREPEVRAVIDRITLQDRGRANPGQTARTAPMSVTQRVRSRKPIEVTLSALPALRPGAPPGVAGLHALNPAYPAITHVSFSIGPDGGLEVLIDVPDNQPADVYAGTVVDTESRQPIGTLAVQVLG